MVPKPFCFNSVLETDGENGQLMLLASSLGIDDGRVSESEVVVMLAVDMITQVWGSKIYL
jgi:hypothetical protein